MFDNEKLAYDLALIYARTKFEVANRNGAFDDLASHNDPEPELEMKSIVVSFNDAYNQYLSYDLSQITEL